jgi:hypothetical protein
MSQQQEYRHLMEQMIRVANRDLAVQLRALTATENHWIRKKSAKMLNVVTNGREDLR